MKRLSNKITIVLIIIIILQIINFTNSKYNTKFFQNGIAKIAEPIIVFESFEEENKLINKLDFPREYQFKIKNYENNKINEIDFLYNIEIIESNNNFPIKYKIFDVSNNKEIIVKNGITETLKISKEIKEEKIYKIILEWEEKEIEMSENLNLKLKLNLKQYKIGEV